MSEEEKLLFVRESSGLVKEVGTGFALLLPIALTLGPWFHYFGPQVSSWYPGAHLVPMYDVYSHLAYAVGRSDVTTTIINGRLVMRNRRLLTLDEDEVVGNAREVSRQIKRWLANR